jgi:hypothetical protein
VGSGPWAELRRVQGLPLATGTQYEENGVHAHPIGCAWPTTAETMRIHMHRQVDCDLDPEIIGDAPLVGNEVSFHGLPSWHGRPGCLPQVAAAYSCYRFFGVNRIGSKRILSRTTGSEDPNLDQIVTVTKIQIQNVASKENAVSPYVVCYSGHKKLFRTTHVANARSANWVDIDVSFGGHDGQPLFCEIWSNGRLSDTLLGGFVIYPVNPKNNKDDGRTVYVTRIDWNWKERAESTLQGLAEMTVEFSVRAKE